MLKFCCIISVVDYKNHQPNQGSTRLRTINIILGILLLLVIGLICYFAIFRSETIEEKIDNQLTYDSTLTDQDISLIEQSIKDNFIELDSPVSVKAELKQTIEDKNNILAVYVPVTNFYSVKQSTTDEELKASVFTVNENIPTQDRDLIADYFQPSETEDRQIGQQAVELAEEEVNFISAESLSSNYKLLSFDDSYYLDDFTSGALFKVAIFEGDSANNLNALQLNEIQNEEEVLKVNMSGVTALTREMQKRLTTVKDPLYFSANIGDFLSDADLTHVSNEVSFLDNCPYSYTLFCSPPEFIETLKASGVDIVELTGNHNNDLGSQANTDSINLYHELGWQTIGGGLNAEEATKPYIADMEGSKVAFLAYNYPDSPNGNAIAGTDKAGANPFDFSYESIQSDIESAKENSDFVIVNIQYWECYSYPDGYIEFPSCDKPIDGQEETFKKMIDLGADMVIGSSAHQPQTYELYEGKPIYYGLGNLYFEQTQWPGTERGIILTHYFRDGVLLQTKLTPTVFDRDLQTRVMTDEEANYLLTRLHDAR